MGVKSAAPGDLEPATKPVCLDHQSDYTSSAESTAGHTLGVIKAHINDWERNSSFFSSRSIRQDCHTMLHMVNEERVDEAMSGSHQ